jgi:hypothetical protein
MCRYQGAEDRATRMKAAEKSGSNTMRGKLCTGDGADVDVYQLSCCAPVGVIFRFTQGSCFGLAAMKQQGDRWNVRVSLSCDMQSLRNRGIPARKDDTKYLGVPEVDGLPVVLWLAGWSLVRYIREHGSGTHGSLPPCPDRAGRGPRIITTASSDAFIT